MAENSTQTKPKLDAKAIKSGIKVGWGYKEFQKKYGCDKRELRFLVSKLYSKNSKDRADILKAIEENSKTSKKAASKASKDAAPNEKKADKEAKSSNVTNSETAPKAEVAAIESNLDGLRAEEAKYSDAVIALENERIKLIAKHRTQVAKMQDVRKDIEDIEARLKACSDKFTAIAAETRATEDDIEKVCASKRDAKAKLDEIRKEIDRNTRVVIFVFNNGNIEVQEGELELDDTDYELVYKTIRDDERLENLRIIDVKTLAKIMCIKANGMKVSPNKRIEFMFDNKDLEAIYTQIG